MNITYQKLLQNSKLYEYSNKYIMKELIRKQWDYILFEKSLVLYLKVLCGSVAIYEIIIKLNDDEKQKYIEKGEIYIDKLAKKIQYSPSNFSDRNIKISKYHTGSKQYLRYYANKQQKRQQSDLE